MSTGRHERRFHPPELPVRPEGLAPETARLLELAVRQAVADAVQALDGDRTGGPTTPAAPPGGARPAAEASPASAPRASVDGYEVPSYADAGRPVALPLLDGPGPAATGAVGRPAGGLGLAAHTGSGARDLGAGARPWGAPASPASSPAHEGEWAPERLATLRTRMGDGFRHAPLGSISLDRLTVGSAELPLVPALGGTGPERTVADRLGAGAFYLDPLARERLGPAATTLPGAGYAVHRVTDDGHRHDTGLRVVTPDTGTVPAGILAYTVPYAGEIGPGADARPYPLEGADGACLFSGLLWGADEHLDQVVECVGALAAAVRPAGHAGDAGDAGETLWFWGASADCVEHPLVLAEQGLRELREIYREKLEQGEFFDAGRVLCQLVLTLLSLPGRLPVPQRPALRRVAVADLGGIGVRALDVIGFLLGEPHATLTAEGALLALAGDHAVLVAVPGDKGTRALSRSELATALEAGDVPLTVAEAEGLARALGGSPGTGPRERRVRREAARRVGVPTRPDTPPVTPG
ncbi:hypothetical protein [Streptomyces sp. NPDC059072]|uniref:hypothetical protein n=1 Tax=Streptomyces sp. NPDC059072 TaxID=3346715 RepID=UPI0036CC991F